MRTTGKRSFVLYILLALFLAGAVWLGISFFINGNSWASQGYNQHLGTSNLGTISDRDGTIVAQTVDGSRIYSDDQDMRLAMLHVVGDNKGEIYTSVQAAMRSKLSGYNPITGTGDTVFNNIGKNIKLSVSSQVNLAAYRALNGHKGAVMVYNYESGEVISQVSSPGFDPLNVPEDLASNESYDGALLDRNLVSAFTPGSIFKLVTQAAAMDIWSDWASRQYTCHGSVEIGGSNISCLGSHGTISAHEAMGQSCNVYYALLANDLGADVLQDKADQMGFNANHKYGDITTKMSVVQLADAGSNQLGWAGVGQHTVVTNPYHMLTLMGAIASGGTYTQPHLTGSNPLNSVLSGDRNYMSSSQAAELAEIMRSNVSNYYGDYLFPEGMQICAKSGTGEVADKRPNCWFVGFAQNPDTPYAFVVLVEEGIGGIESAGAAASAVMQAVNDYV